MKHLIFYFSLSLLATGLAAQADRVNVVEANDGTRLVVNGEPFMVNGMNWDYFPIGTNFNYSLWNQSDAVIRAALDTEMSLLKNMGVNTVRMYTGVQPKWIAYIYENYGIYTMLNHSFGRYGLTIDGSWVAVTDYRDPKTKELLMSEATKLAEQYQNTPGLLMYLLGNENNYGLFWAGAETEDFPEGEERINAVGEARGRPMYRLMNDAAKSMKSIDGSHPVAICNGDLLFLNIVAEECPDVDIYGTNMYRGVSFGDAFERVKNEYGKPILFTEFGADAFNAITNAEDQESQAYYMLGNWQDIYANAAGLGQAGNSIGGFTFQFSDGWWKYGQTKNLDVHDANASWANGGYGRDLLEGQNNMNEEWFGICAKGPTNERGLYDLYPRAAYYALDEAHDFDPYAEGQTLGDLNQYFGDIELMGAVLKARGDKAALEVQSGGSRLSISRLTANIAAINTGGSLISTPDEDDPGSQTFPNRKGFDHMQSFFVGVQGRPSPDMRVEVQFNVLGNVAQNPINEIFYENRGRPVAVQTPFNGPATLGDVNRVVVYRAEYEWNHDLFDLKGFYRTGHYHWAYEGDFFGLYPEANYGPNIDIYNGTAPLGAEFYGKKQLKGLSVAIGPELWWGANPAIIAKYTREVARFKVTGMFHEDLEQRVGSESSFAIPTPKTRRGALAIERKFGAVGLELGGMWAGQPLVGRTFQLMNPEDPTDMTAYQDEIDGNDLWAGKIKLTYANGRFQWYASGAAHGLVANGGADPTITFTGWKLKDSGSGNMYNALTGFTIGLGKLQIAPNFLWQRPMVGPMMQAAESPGRLRNILVDPFVVRGGNRETVAGEILLTYDPTPGSFFYEWNNDRAEDAKFAANVGFVYRHLPTSQDAAIGILSDGRTFFGFPGAAPAQDLWEAHARLVSKFSPEAGLIANVFTGTAQANGDSERTIWRSGIDLRMIYNKLKLIASYAHNDWGPFDYHRDFNQTFPHQVSLDLSTTLSKPDWFDLPNTELGIMGIFRTLNEFSPRYCPVRTMNAAGNFICDPNAVGFANGNEWEIRTYININIF
jgi:hypothetical protein